MYDFSTFSLQDKFIKETVKDLTKWSFQRDLIEWSFQRFAVSRLLQKKRVLHF